MGRPAVNKLDRRTCEKPMILRAARCLEPVETDEPCDQCRPTFRLSVSQSLTPEREHGMLPQFNRWKQVGIVCRGEFHQDSFSGNAAMADGVIKKVLDKGFGFITTGNGKDLFFHSSAVQGGGFNELREGQKVTYTEAMGQKGPCAENVKAV
jgi:CspA family cold shock protein